MLIVYEERLLFSLSMQKIDYDNETENQWLYEQMDTVTIDFVNWMHNITATGSLPTDTISKMDEVKTSKIHSSRLTIVEVSFKTESIKRGSQLLSIDTMSEKIREKTLSFRVRNEICSAQHHKDHLAMMSNLNDFACLSNVDAPDPYKHLKIPLVVKLLQQDRLEYRLWSRKSRNWNWSTVTRWQDRFLRYRNYGAISWIAMIRLRSWTIWDWRMRLRLMSQKSQSHRGAWQSRRCRRSQTYAWRSRLFCYNKLRLAWFYNITRYNELYTTNDHLNSCWSNLHSPEATYPSSLSLRVSDMNCLSLFVICNCSAIYVENIKKHKKHQKKEWLWQTAPVDFTVCKVSKYEQANLYHNNQSMTSKNKAKLLINISFYNLKRWDVIDVEKVIVEWIELYAIKWYWMKFKDKTYHNRDPLIEKRFISFIKR